MGGRACNERGFNDYQDLCFHRGFARQPRWMAGTIDSFSHGNKCSF